MSATQTPIQNDQSDILRCTHCNAVLPLRATFCGQCGERILKSGQDTSSVDYNDIVDRYRITSLVRRRPYTQLFFAFDNQQHQTVAIHSINMRSLKDEERTRAIEAFQYEYDLLRRHSLPAIMRLVDLRYFQEHLYLVATWPRQDAHGQAHHLSTLFSLLQSGIGLPDEQVAIAWIYRLSRTLEFLHKNSMITGDLDPDTILVHQANFDGDPALMSSWLPPFLPHPSIDTNTAYFYAPEAITGESEPRSDIYSLGAILYLLLSGVTPKAAATRLHEPLTGLRELNPRMSSSIEMVVMRALALNKEERYQSASEFSDALLQLSAHPHDLRTTQKTPFHSIQATQDKHIATPATATSSSKAKNQAEIHVSSSVADNTSDTGVDTQATEVMEDVPTSIVPLQAQMARRYLSKIKTGKAEIQEKKSGEEPVEEGLLKKEADAGEEVVESTTKIHTDDPMTIEYPPSANYIYRGETTPEEISVEEIGANLAETSRESSASRQEAIQAQPTLPLDSKREVAGKLDQIDDSTPGLEQLDTVPFSYPTPTVSHVEEQEQVQKAQDQQPESTRRALQVRGSTSLQKHSSAEREPISERLKAIFVKTTTTLPEIMRLRGLVVANRPLFKPLPEPKEGSLLQQVQHFLLGEPQNSTKAAALIETPLRIQPGQNYSIRINVIGRNDHRDTQTAGLSALTKGEKVHIEVRSALYQNYAYIVQQADIQMPAEGYVAEVTMPMQPLSGGPSGRRERLHIFFMDENNNPLYEKPFVIEIFISHLVQSGREGHNVLSIPL